MAIQYTRVNEVAPGQRILSSQWNQLAKAVNDRLKHGVADCSWRLWWYAHSVFRGIRRPDASGFNWPAEDEWWKFYSHIKADAGMPWPETDPGDPEGINLGNPIGAFVFGQGPGQRSEDGRLNYDPVDGTGLPLHDAVGAPVTDLDHWELGKYQRGVTDATGEDLDAANALVAAEDYLRIQYPDAGRGSMFLHQYGGFYASPTVKGQCSEDETNPGSELFDIDWKFGKYTDTPDTDCVYASCPEGSGSGSCPNTSKPIVGYFAGSKSYVLLHWDGTVTHLPFNDYIEGPYTDNAYLRREKGGQLDFAINAYAAQFRGAEGQRHNAEQYGFSFRNFFTRQYYLAPSYGIPSGYAPGEMSAVYPAFDFPANTTKDTFGLASGSSTHTIHTGFVFAGLIAVGNDLTEPKTFAIHVNHVQVMNITIGAGDSDKSHWFPIVYREGSIISVKTLNDFGATEEAYVEIAEILEMKPRVEDAYLVVRMASSINTTLDGNGREEPNAKDIWEDYARHGMIYNGSRDGIKDQDYINRNPIYDELRRSIIGRLRMAERVLIQGYEIVDGKSVLYFDRYARGMVNKDLDVFEGIAPSDELVSSGSIQKNIVYVVRGTSVQITYNSVAYTDNETFTGVDGVSTFTVDSGDPEVFEHEGIVDTAPEQGESNEWQMFISSNVYQDSESSDYKPENYADVLGALTDRCTFLSKSWREPFNADAAMIRNHVNYGISLINRPENPSGYRYLLGKNVPNTGSGSTNLVTESNTLDCGSDVSEENCPGMAQQYKSCQIYVPDYEVESVTMTASGQVRVQLSGRLAHNDDAPGTISNSVASWNSYVSTETGPRRDENTLIEYLLYHQDGRPCLLRIGDQSGDADVTSGWNTSIVHGSCFPRFYFTKRMPLVYEDGNDVANPTDSPLTVDNLLWSEFFIRAVCEGYVDEKSTIDVVTELDQNGLLLCGAKRLYDYRWSTLNEAANGRRWFTLDPSRAEEDNPEGHGPFPTMYPYAEFFNQIARALNKLFRARIDLPNLGVRHQTMNYQDTWPASFVMGQGCCNPFCASWVDGAKSPGATTFVAPGDLIDDVTFPVYLKAFRKTSLDVDAFGNCAIKETRRDEQFEIYWGNFSDLAMSDGLRNLVITSLRVGIFAAEDTPLTWHVRRIISEEEIGTECTGFTQNDFRDDFGNKLVWDPINTEFNSRCVFVTAGTLTAQIPPTSDLVTGCSGSAESTRNLTINAVQAFVDVPLV